MTKPEYDAWMEETKKSEYKWNFDDITWYNHKEVLAYIGGVDGKYVRISKDGELEFGTYEGAIPHIGEAIFQRKAHKKYENYDEAFKAAVELGGMYFLQSMFMS